MFSFSHLKDDFSYENLIVNRMLRSLRKEFQIFEPPNFFIFLKEIFAWTKNIAKSHSYLNVIPKTGWRKWAKYN